MRNFLLSLFIFLIWAFIGMWWYYSCPWCSGSIEKDSTQKEIVIPSDEQSDSESNNIEATIENNKLYVKDDIGNHLFSFPNGIKIFKNTDSIDIPNTSLAIKDSIFNYLNTHQDQELQIIGWFNNNEIQNKSDSLNLGFNRANYLKDILSDFGVNTDKIYIKAEKHTFNFAPTGDYLGGIKLFFKKISENHSEEINKGITNKTLYSHFNQRLFKPDNTLQGYAFELKNYLQKHPDKKVLITGHTDSVGEEETNEIVARDRASNVMRYLISQGIDETKLEVSSKGELAPIANNNTNEGRAKNRRIEINVN